MFEQLFQGFTQSRQGQSAMQQLGAQGYSPQQSMGILSAGLPVAAQSMQAQLAGGAQGGQGGQLGLTNIGGSHYGMNFLAGAVTGLLRGDGLMGSAVDGAESVVGGHVAEVIASRFGFSRSVAGVVGAIITPLMVDYLMETFRGGGGGMPNFTPSAPAAVPGGGGMLGMMGAALGVGGAAYGASQFMGAGQPQAGFVPQGSFPGGYVPPGAYPGAYPQQGYDPGKQMAAQQYEQKQYEAQYQQKQYEGQYQQKQEDAYKAQQAQYNPGWGGNYGKGYDPGYDPGYADPSNGWDKKDKGGW